MAAPLSDVSASYQRRHSDSCASPRQHPPRRVQKRQPAKSCSIHTPTVQQHNRKLREHFFRHHQKESDLSIELPANAASKLALEAEKALPSRRSMSSTQGTSWGFMRRMHEYVFRLD